MINIRRVGTAVIIAAILLLLTVYSCGRGADRDHNKKHPDARERTARVASPDSVTILLAGADSLTVFELLRNSHRVEYKSTATGVFVTSVDSVQNGNGVCWIYSVNDTMPAIACDRSVTSHGDTVKWHFRKVGK